MLRLCVGFFFYYFNSFEFGIKNRKLNRQKNKRNQTINKMNKETFQTEKIIKKKKKPGRLQLSAIFVFFCL